jgi:transposase InsO family protein
VKLPVTKLCESAGMSRQNYYKSHDVRMRKKVDGSLIKQLVQTERGIQPRIGCVKLYAQLSNEIKEADINIGRDRFFEVLRQQGLMLKRLPKAPRTTNSRHSLPVFTNLIKEMELTCANQVWVSDITYIRIKDRFLYLSLITDKYSRKIVGYHLAESLEAQETLKALEMALRSLPEGVYPIHHSDRGIQYCSHKYVNELKKHKILISMTEENHCAENALAERVNGILKQEYFLGQEFKSVKQAHKSVNESINIYNNRRLHRSLNLRTPSEIHRLVA